MKNSNQNSLLKSILVSIILLCFTVLIAGGFWIFKSMAPRPLKLIDGKGNVVSTRNQIEGGQAIFQKYGLMIMEQYLDTGHIWGLTTLQRP